MGTYKIYGTVSEDATIYVIDEDSKKLHRATDFSAGNYEIKNLSPGDKTVTAVRSSGESVTYGKVTPVTMSGTGTAYSSGNDGSLVIDTADTVVNSYAAITSVSGNTITVDSVSEFSVDDEVMIIQMQGDNSIIGFWETKRISGINSNVITFNSSIENTYSTASNDKVQAVRIPNYINFEVASGYNVISSAWDGSKGGIIFFRATNSVTITGGVVSNGDGFRGGVGRGGNTNRYGWSGESTQPASFESIASRNYVPAGGGGAGWCGTASQYTPTGGGGGGYGTAGTNGKQGPHPAYPNISFGGPAYGSADLSKMFFGSAGGAAIDNRGANGGGIVIISAFTINVTGSVEAEGETGSENYLASAAGGSILLQANYLNIGTNLISAIGGPATQYGGAGGDGRIRLDYTTISGSTSTPTPGYIGSY